MLSSYKFDEYIDGKLGVVNGSNSDNNTTTNPNDGDGCALLAALNFTAPGGNANWSNNFQYSTGYDNNTATGSGNSSQGTTIMGALFRPILGTTTLGEIGRQSLLGTSCSWLLIQSGLLRVATQRGPQQSIPASMELALMQNISLMTGLAWPVVANT